MVGGDYLVSWDIQDFADHDVAFSESGKADVEFVDKNVLVVGWLVVKAVGYVKAGNSNAFLPYP